MVSKTSGCKLYWNVKTTGQPRQHQPVTSRAFRSRRLAAEIPIRTYRTYFACFKPALFFQGISHYSTEPRRGAVRILDFEDGMVRYGTVRCGFRLLICIRCECGSATTVKNRTAPYPNRSKSLDFGDPRPTARFSTDNKFIACVRAYMEHVSVSGDGSVGAPRGRAGGIAAVSAAPPSPNGQRCGLRGVIGRAGNAAKTDRS